MYSIWQSESLMGIGVHIFRKTGGLRPRCNPQSPTHLYFKHDNSISKVWIYLVPSIFQGWLRFLRLWPECDEYIAIFKFLNILGTNIYSVCINFLYEYIRTFVCVKFVCTNIFRHSLVSVLECKTLTNIWIYSNIRAIFNTNTYSDIRSCQKN